MRSEKAKMLGGERYDPLDPQLAAERRRARARSPRRRRGRVARRSRDRCRTSRRSRVPFDSGGYGPERLTCASPRWDVGDAVDDI